MADDWLTQAFSMILQRPSASAPVITQSPNSMVDVGSSQSVTKYFYEITFSSDQYVPTAWRGKTIRVDDEWTCPNCGKTQKISGYSGATGGMGFNVSCSYCAKGVNGARGTGRFPEMYAAYSSDRYTSVKQYSQTGTRTTLGNSYTGWMQSDFKKQYGGMWATTPYYNNDVVTQYHFNPEVFF